MSKRAKLANMTNSQLKLITKLTVGVLSYPPSHHLLGYDYLGSRGLARGGSSRTVSERHVEQDPCVPDFPQKVINFFPSILHAPSWKNGSGNVTRDGINNVIFRILLIWILFTTLYFKATGRP